MYKTLMEKIIKNGNKEGMDILGETFNDAMEMVEEYCPKEYAELEMQLHEGAYGEVLSESMAEEWVESMEPKAKWGMEDTTNLMRSRGINMPSVAFYVLANMGYSDDRNLLGEGDTDESLDKYCHYAKDWYFDSDVGDGDKKLYRYYKYVVKGM